MIPIDLIFEDESILVVNKPGGIATQAPREFDSLERRVRAYLAETSTSEHSPYLGIPHRLDRCASGAIVFAKRVKAAQRLSKQFERREVQKTYVARVTGGPEDDEGECRDFMRKIPDQPRSEITDEACQDAKLAVLRYKVISRGPRGITLTITLETGRMHQIRLQLSARGYPILGDETYGSWESFGPTFDHIRERWIALHAVALGFRHPKNREDVTFQAPFPSFWDDE